MVTTGKLAASRDGLAAAALLALAWSGSALAQETNGMGPVPPTIVPPTIVPTAAVPTAIVPSPIACPAAPAALPAELSGWNRRVPLAAGRDSAAAARVNPGAAVDAALSPAPDVRYALPPEKAGGSTGFGGLFAVTVTTPGHYRVALGAAAWIDVIAARPATGTHRALTSIAHAHGPDCSGIRKMVDFALEPGDYLVQIAASPDAALPLLVTRLP
ncbi:homogentisate 1,2-dioxygenase [Sphingomonas sp. IC081]|uniref:homogentisate 1,2-dioxygenase n=1 Tax=Sphingomonas sp. IC081 TaxID=304378 RepID=UPI0021B04883|nr:homogentisate 1,2-dioxygenase [Sphingomonas sp. IC081]